MDEIFVALSVPIIVFLVIVAPIWLVLHYRSKSRALEGLSSDERSELEQLTLRAEQMSERIETLEAILDQDSPGWRTKSP